MKKKLTRHCLFGTILVFLVLWGCKQDDFYNERNNNRVNSKGLKIRTLRGIDAQRAAEKLKNEVLNMGRISIQSENGIAFKTADTGTIKYDEILEVIDSLGNKNYTFRIEGHPEEDDKSFFNLVVNVKEQEQKVLLLKYNMDDTFASSYKNGTSSMEMFTGSITIGNIGYNPCDDNNDNSGNTGGAPVGDTTIIIFENPGNYYPGNYYPNNNNNNGSNNNGNNNSNNGSNNNNNNNNNNSGNNNNNNNPNQISDSDSGGLDGSACAQMQADCKEIGGTYYQWVGDGFINCECTTTKLIFDPVLDTPAALSVLTNIPNPCGDDLGAIGILEDVKNKTKPCDELKNLTRNETRNDSLRRASFTMLQQSTGYGSERGFAFRMSPNGLFLSPEIVGSLPGNNAYIDMTSKVGGMYIGLRIPIPTPQ